MAWDERQQLECEVCKTERARRSRVLRGAADGRLNEEAFVKAPYVHPFNQVKYRTLLWRAMDYAHRLKRRLHWVQAVDQPLAGEAETLKGVALDRARELWLLKHDKETAGIMGLFPLILGMRVRFTETIDRDLQIAQTPLLHRHLKVQLHIFRANASAHVRPIVSFHQGLPPLQSILCGVLRSHGRLCLRCLLLLG